MLLILNLLTKSRYWIELKSLEEKIFEKITDDDIDGEPFILEEMTGGEFEILQMNISENQIEINYHYKTDYDSYDDVAELLIG